jgi:glycosyltransferase involved in cell wall biosynthesis
VQQEAQALAERGHEVRVFSSDRLKGVEKERAEASDKIGKVKIRRFPARKLGGESFMTWDFLEEGRRFGPDVILAHSYRHGHTAKALKLGNELGVPVILVTHAPFGQDTRDGLSGMAVKVYDTALGRRALKEFAHILAITKWEEPYLLELGLSKGKIGYSPNGIADYFFSKVGKFGDLKKILFFGRVSPMKDLETLLRALSLLDEDVVLEIVGPVEEAYGDRLRELVGELGLGSRVSFKEAVFAVKEKVKLLDSVGVFVLPSKREGMPQALVEAMARQRICVVSNTAGSSELVEDGKTGFVFPVGSVKGCARALEKALGLRGLQRKRMGMRARGRVSGFGWEKIVAGIEKLF